MLQEEHGNVTLSEVLQAAQKKEAADLIAIGVRVVDLPSGYVARCLSNALGSDVVRAYVRLKLDESLDLARGPFQDRSRLLGLDRARSEAEHQQAR